MKLLKRLISSVLVVCMLVNLVPEFTLATYAEQAKSSVIEKSIIEDLSAEVDFVSVSDKNKEKDLPEILAVSPVITNTVSALSYEEFTYTIDSNTGNVAITGYTGNATELNIPSEIDGHPVTEIGAILHQSKNSSCCKRFQLP